jgi:hypothetical protein
VIDSTIIHTAIGRLSAFRASHSLTKYYTTKLMAITMNADDDTTNFRRSENQSHFACEID